MKLKWKHILKIISIVIILFLELFIWLNIWIGKEIAKFGNPNKIMFFLGIIIIFISVIDSAIELLIDLFKGVTNKKHRNKRIQELETEIVNIESKWKKIPKLFHLMIFENTWLLVLVFILHSSEWIVNGWSLAHGDTKSVEFYSIGMRTIEYPIVTITLLISFFKNSKKTKRLWHNEIQMEVIKPQGEDDE